MKARKIPGFEAEYVITRDARVFRRRDSGFKEISQATNPEGYKTVVLYSGGKPHFKYIHQLMGETYLDNPDSKKIINHKDGNKGNCSLKNLVWADGAENTEHAYDTGLAHGAVGETNGQTDLSDADVAQIRKSNKSGQELAKQHGVSPAAISMIKNKKRRAVNTPKEVFCPEDIADLMG